MRSLVLLPLLTATVIRFTSCPVVVTPAPPDTNTAQRVTLSDGFEGGLINWVQDADLPNDPNNPGQPVAAFITVSTEQALEGSHSARFSLDGTQDDGTI